MEDQNGHRETSAVDRTRPRLNRRRVLQAAGAGATGMLAGCFNDGNGNGGGGNGNGNGGGEVHVLTDYATDAWKTMWDSEIVPGFEQETGTPVNVEYVGASTAGDQRLQTLMQAGDPPTLYTATFSQVNGLVSQKQHLPVDDVLDEMEAENGETLFRDNITINGEATFMPRGMYTASFIYRTDIYDRLGLAVPETWDELLENARIIDEDPDTEARGFGIGGGRNLKASTHFNTLLATAGGGYYQWETEGEEAGVWLDEEQVTAALEFAGELSEYSLDPSSMTWGSSISNWAGGQLAQDISLNAWAAGAAYRAKPEIGLNTGVALPPKRSGADLLDHGGIFPEGAPIIKGSTNPEGGKELWKYMHGTPDKLAGTMEPEPMRFLPTYASVTESDTYTGFDFFQAEDGYFLDLNRKIIEENVPNLANPDRPQTPATLYASSYLWDAEMMNAVLAQGRSASDAYQAGFENAEQRLSEGKEKAAW